MFLVNIKEPARSIWWTTRNSRSLKITEVEAERFLHDGGLRPTGRYFLTAANARNEIVVIDTRDRRAGR